MNRTLLQLVLRHTADTDGSDPDLLRRFVASRDEAAFAALVRRHGPLVWAACRHLIPNRADAEDAFQATFLALAKSAKSVRKPEQLASWLHGAAVRIAGKAKRGFTRRTVHERATARPEADSPVAAGSWNEMLAAVHDEVAKLPRSLRAAFVLCDLEGVDAADAANRLGVKANTLSGQLARARQRLLDALTKRGIGAGLATIGTAVAVPQALADKAVGVIGLSPAALNPTVIELASEVTAMKLSNLKLLAAGFMLTCGLSLTGLGLLPNADGQPPGGLPGTGGPPGGGGVRPGGPPGGTGPMGGAPGGLPPGPGIGSPDGGGRDLGGMMGGAPGPKSGLPPRAEYLYAAKPASLIGVKRLLDEKARQNWELTTTLDVDSVELQMATPEDKKAFEGITEETRKVLVFKRTGTVPLSAMSGMRTGGPGMGMPGGETGMPGTGSGMMPGGPGMRPGGGGTGTGTAPGRSSEVYEVYRLKNANAADAAKVLNEVFNGPGEGPGRVRVVAEKESNSIIVVKASAVDLKTIDALLKKALDVKADEQPKGPPPMPGGDTGSPDGGGGVETPKRIKVTFRTDKLTQEVSDALEAVLTQNGGSGALLTGGGSSPGGLQEVTFTGTEAGIAAVRKLMKALDPKATEVKPAAAGGR